MDGHRVPPAGRALPVHHARRGGRHLEGGAQGLWAGTGAWGHAVGGGVGEGVKRGRKGEYGDGEGLGPAVWTCGEHSGLRP